MQVALTGAKTVSKVTLSDDVFAVPLNKSLLAQAVRTQLANQRSANAHTKKRGEVSGGGRKPWRQKGTGRARVGSSRTPLWRGGGIIFGPDSERNYSIKLPGKMARQAFRQALSLKASENRLFVLADITLDKPSTQGLLSHLLSLGVDFRDAVIVLGSVNKAVQLSARNVPNLKAETVGSLNTYKVLRAETLFITESALEALQGPQKAPAARKTTARAIKPATEEAA